MTPDSPKGPESEAPARERVAEYYRTLWGYASHNEQTWQAADRALEALRPDIEQMLFERDAANATADTLVQQLTDLRDDVLGDESIQIPEVITATKREAERLTAEVERLRSMYDLAERQYAEQTGELKTDRDRYKAAHASTQRGLIRMEVQRDEARTERDWWKRAAEAETQGRRVEVSRLREQLAAQQRVWAPEDPTDESACLANALRFVGVVDPDDDCMSVFDTTGEGIKHWVPVDAIALRMLDHMGGVSSSEVEAPQPQDAVTLPANWTQQIGWLFDVDEVERYTKVVRLIQMWQGQRDGTGDTEHDEFAMTLRPQLRSDEGRPSGSERLAPRTELDYAVRLKTECRATEGMTGIDCHLSKGHVGWHSGRHNPRSDATDSVGYPVCIQWPRNEWDRCEPERVAAQAARSEATPKQIDCKADCAATDPECRCSEEAWHRTCCHAPSPSLRKEGEDTPSLAVSPPSSVDEGNPDR